MRIYRKVIPQIAKDIINSLLNKGLIEIDDNKKIEEAELDLAAIIVEYQNTEDKISKEAQQTIIKRSISIDKYTLASKSLTIMSDKKITCLCVHDKKNKNRTIGILKIHSILDSNIR